MYWETIGHQIYAQARDYIISICFISFFERYSSNIKDTKQHSLPQYLTSFIANLRHFHVNLSVYLTRALGGWPIDDVWLSRPFLELFSLSCTFFIVQSRRPKMFIPAKNTFTSYVLYRFCLKFSYFSLAVL